MSKEMQYRNDGMAFAYKIAKEQGIEALEKEIAYRNAKMMPSAVQRKTLRNSRMRLNRIVWIRCLLWH